MGETWAIVVVVVASVLAGFLVVTAVALFRRAARDLAADPAAAELRTTDSRGQDAIAAERDLDSFGTTPTSRAPDRLRPRTGRTRRPWTSR